MQGIALGLIVGACALLLTAPSSWLPPLLAVAAGITALARPSWRPAMIALLAGLALAAGTLQARLDNRLSPRLAGVDLIVEGRVAGLPEHDDRRRRFEFLPERSTLKGEPVNLPRRVRLSWYGRDTPAVRPGERWRLSVRLRVPRGFANPGGFDYAGWLLRHGIGATGYVRGEPAPRRLEPGGWSVHALRAALRERLQPLLAERAHRGVLLALTLGDRGDIGTARWQTLVATGTNHLMAISGLHVGLVALLGYALGALAWRCCPHRARTRCARPVVQSLVALVLASGYAALAGFALPTTRALTMLALALGAICLRRRVRPFPVLASAAVVVVALDPLAVLDAGFWLSFGAVAAIVTVAAGRLGRPRRSAGWVRLQLAISLALAPLLLLLFQQASLIAPVANLFAVPWVSVITVPGALAGAALAPWWPAAGGMLLALADLSLDVLWWLLEWMAALPMARWRSPAYPPLLPALAACGAFALLLPRGVPGKAGALLALLPLLLWQPPRPGPGGVWLDVLDVGQGLAVVVRTAGHTLVYDTGPRFSASFDTGSAVVVPFLQAAGVEQLDALVISHGDNDHAGGAESVRQRFPPARSWTSMPQGTGAADTFCAARESWTWDGVRFAFIHPHRDGGWRGNNGSCVLRIEGAGGTILLPGDIERGAERRLVESGPELAADVIVAPHHGSDTSSTPAFVEAVDPGWVLYSVGYRNQWGFPRPGVVRRWRPAGLARTDCGGRLQVRIEAERGVTPPRAWRLERPRRWDGGCAGPDKSGTMRAFEAPAADHASGDTEASRREHGTRSRDGPGPGRQRV